MTLLATYLDHTRATSAWVAQWRTAGGNSIRQRLPLDPYTTSEADAWIYALDNYPERGTLA